MAAKEEKRQVEKILDVRVQPRASRNEILGFQEGSLRVRVQAPPREGEANHLLRKILAEALRVPLSRVEILAGHKGRRKRVRVIDASSENLRNLEKAQVIKV